MNAFEKKVLDLTNAERQKARLTPLKCNDKLATASRSWSVQQCKDGRISHNNFSARVRATGLPLRGASENVAAGQPSPESVVHAWMKSPGHRANILRSSSTHLGVGYHNCPTSRYRHFWTQIFGVLR